MEQRKAYEHLCSIGKQLRLLTSFAYFLEWDQETFMPKGATEFRSEQIELISSMIHREKTSDGFKNSLQALVDLQTGKLHYNNLNDQQKANLREWHRDYSHEIKLPNDFVKTFAKTASKATSAWVQAKKNDTFEVFAPYLEKLINLCRKKADYIGYYDHPYDALLSIYEPGMTTKTLQSIFRTLKPFLKDLLQDVTKSQISDDILLDGTIPYHNQKEFIDYLLKIMGLNPKYSRLDFSEHPFCLGMHPHDVRLTTHLTSSNFMHTISAVMHEAGHALYELHLPIKQYGTPIGEFCSYGIHESQSRWWETIIGLGRPFWKFVYPKLQEIFPDALQKIHLDTFYQTINRVSSSLIRIHADEISYILHIILRFEIELAFLEKQAFDLPTIWNQKMNELLNITPKNNREGCLQDIHWAAGLFGYFPSYALGNLYAAQLYEVFKDTSPNYVHQVEQGNLGFIIKFLTKKIHRFGRQYPPLELIEKATGKPLSPEPYMNYLKEKYVS